MTPDGTVPRGPRILLVAGGAGCLLAGFAAVAAGMAVPARLLDLLPPVAIDAQAVGGAAVALGVLLAALGAAQVGIGVALRAGRSWRLAAGIVFTALTAALAAAIGVALLTQAAAGGSLLLVPAGLALVGVAAAYLAAAWRLAGSRPRPGAG